MFDYCGPLIPDRAGIHIGKEIFWADKVQWLHRWDELGTGHKGTIKKCVGQGIMSPSLKVNDKRRQPVSKFQPPRKVLLHLI